MVPVMVTKTKTPQQPHTTRRMPNPFEHCSIHSDIHNSHNLAECVHNVLTKTDEHRTFPRGLPKEDMRELKEMLNERKEDINENTRDVVKANLCKHVAMAVSVDRDRVYDECLDHLGVHDKEKHDRKLEAWEQLKGTPLRGRMEGNPFSVNESESKYKFSHHLTHELDHTDKEDHEKVMAIKALHEERERHMGHHEHHHGGIGEENSKHIHNLEEGQKGIMHELKAIRNTVSKEASERREM